MCLFSKMYVYMLMRLFVLYLLMYCSVRTKISSVAFPKFILGYFLLFNLYCENYQHGYRYLALFGTYLLVMHLFFVFYNQYEIPALENGTVHALAPRH